MDSRGRTSASTEKALTKLCQHDQLSISTVLTAMEVLQAKGSPQCTSLCTHLLSAAAPQLDRATTAHKGMQGHMISPALASSFICSLKMLWSNNLEMMKAAVTCSLVPPDTATKTRSHTVTREEFRTAKLLADKCVRRVLPKWRTQVKTGQVHCCSCSMLSVKSLTISKGQA